MSDLQTAIRKAPSAIQATFGFALIAVSMYIITNSQQLSTGGPLALWLLFCLVGGLYLINGLPSFIEGVMTMNAEYEERKRLLQQPKKP
jgi:hypothetical protein